MLAKVVSLNVVYDQVPDVGGTVGITSIDKRPVKDAREVTTSGVAGDSRSDMEYHGSPNQAVYAFALEDYDWWSAQLEMALTPGQFGENLTTTGIDLNALIIGTKVKVGSALLQVTTPRIPCGTFQRWMNLDQWVKRFTQGGRPGTYLRVLENGLVKASDEFEIIEVPNHDVTILDYFKVHTGDRDQERVNRCVNCSDIELEARDKFAKFLI
jgi:MOSC domain-containing protein YiiM